MLLRFFLMSDMLPPKRQSRLPSKLTDGSNVAEPELPSHCPLSVPTTQTAAPVSSLESTTPVQKKLPKAPQITQLKQKTASVESSRSSNAGLNRSEGSAEPSVSGSNGVYRFIFLPYAAVPNLYAPVFNS